MQINIKSIVVGLSALCVFAVSHAGPFLIKVKQPFVNPDIPSVMIVQELNLSQAQVEQLRDVILKYRSERRDLAPGYENKHRTILQGSQATEAPMVNLIIRSGRELAGILTPEQQKKVETLEGRAEAIASTGYPLALWELADYSKSKQEKIIAIGQQAAEKLSKLPATAPTPERESIVSAAWAKLKTVLSRDEYSQVVEMMQQHNIPIPHG